MQTVSITDVAADTSLTIARTGTTIAPTMVIVDGTTATTDKISLSAKGTITLETASADQVNQLDLSGNGADVNYKLNAIGDQPTTVTFTGDQSVTLAMSETQAAGLTTMTDSTTAGITTTKIGAVTASRDLKAITSDVIDISGAITAASVINR